MVYSKGNAQWVSDHLCLIRESSTLILHMPWSRKLILIHFVSFNIYSKTKDMLIRQSMVGWLRASHLHTSSCMLKNTRAGVVRRTRNQSTPLTYEQTKKPQQIGVLKSWNSWNTSNLENESRYTADITTQDQFIRLFIRGTFPLAVESEVIFVCVWMPVCFHAYLLFFICDGFPTL